MSGVEGPGVIGGGGGGGPVQWDEIENVPAPVSALGSGSPVDITTNQLNMQGQILVARGGAGGVLGASPVNNYEPPNSATENWAIVFPSGPTTITGLVMETVGNIVDRTFTIENGSSADDVTLANDDAGSTIGNRFLLPEGVDFVLHPTETVTLIYAGNNNWQVFNTGLGSGAAAGDTTLVAFKPADTSRSNTTTFTDDPDLVFTNVPAGSYRYTAYLNVTCPNGTPDFKFALVSSNAVTAGTSNFQSVVYAQGDATPMGNSTNSAIVTSAASGQVVAPVTGGNALGTTFIVTGTYVVGSTSNLAVQWTQAAADANATTLKRGSFMTLTPM